VSSIVIASVIGWPSATLAASILRWVHELGAAASRPRERHLTLVDGIVRDGFGNALSGSMGIAENIGRSHGFVGLAEYER
jgi:hypothetical protein